MKFNKLHIALILTAGLSMSACKDSAFLDVPSQEIVEEGDKDQVYTPESFVNAIYGMFTDWNYAFSYVAITDMLSDNADKGSSPTDPGGDKQEIDNLVYTSSSGSFGALWSHWYKAIGRATQSIELTESTEIEDAAYKSRLIGEAKFLRALNYFYLVRGWGDVPIQEQDLIIRAPKAEVYAYIIKDLKEAIEALPIKSAYAPKDLGRATKGAAQALLSKVYLYNENWTEAYNSAKEVINSGQYGLESKYEVLWRASSENGTESIFEFQGRGEAIAHGVHQYSEVQGARGITGWGWGFNTPSENLLNAFNAEKDDIRRDATIIFRGETLYDGRLVGTGVENPMYNEKAYSSANAGAGDGDKNVRYLRLGEVYLILAEAANEMGNTAEATSALNTIRNRVKLPNTTASTQADLRKAIWKERRLELAFEHDRWFDLVRTKQAPEAMKVDGKTFTEKHYLFPIPYEQLTQTPDMVKNPGY
ncbi:RagB/SusD family nutrient uptake outer membrane protein [Sphingobacterium sp. SG20118]|uniref:RagB/SusD family nutrient uptake outer membrane protein n=1 Tax=Sphingobacterium sp. SG20118 TaxID=3367156 RepID=UPI0037DFC263